MEISVQAHVNDDRRTTGILTVKQFSPAERIRNALKKLSIFWLLAMVSILIPVLHFVLVPVFLGLGLFMAVRAYKAEAWVLHGSTQCPHCRVPVEVHKAELHWPLTEICQNCARVLRIEK